MAFSRRLLRNAVSLRVLCWLIQAYVRLVYRSGSWTIEGVTYPRAVRDSGSAFILAFWHGRLLMMPIGWQALAPMHMLISSHLDGRLIAGAVRYFGIDSVAGSTSEGGSAAVRGMVRWLRSGDCVGITPDGPDGPAMRASRGTVAVARLSGVPVVPLAYATKRRRIFTTWDRFHLPFPFSRGIFLWGEPIYAPRESDEAGMEACRVLIEQRLNALTAEADRRMGHDALTPSDLSRRALRDLRRAGQRQ